MDIKNLEEFVAIGSNEDVERFNEYVLKNIPSEMSRSYFVKFLIENGKIKNHSFVDYTHIICFCCERGEKSHNKKVLREGPPSFSEEILDKYPKLRCELCGR